MSYPSNPNIRPGRYLQIAAISVVFGLIVVGVSSAFLGKIREDQATPGLNANNGSSNLTEEKDTLILVVSISIAATLLQLFASIALWCTKERESKPLVFGFIGGQILIQSVLIACLVYVLLEHFKSPHSSADHPILTSLPQSSSHGKLFWIILGINVIFHFGAVTYLAILVNKRSGYEEEEMTAVVVHRRVPSRIPKTKRHGMQ